MKTTTKSSLLKTILATGAMALMVGQAWADDNPKETDNVPDKTFYKNLDKNQDGYIDQSEASVHPTAKAAFDRADKRKEGKVTIEQFYSEIPGGEAKK